jgi:cohesin complex subunit SA-1/2
MKDLVNFVLKASGCDLEIDEHDIQDQDNVTGKLTDLQEEYQAVSYLYALIRLFPFPMMLTY